jgi:hypothetical protein
MFEGAPTPEIVPTGDIFKFKLDIQKWLIRENCEPGEDLDENYYRWTKENSNEFRMVFDEMLKEDPQLTDLRNRWGDSEGVETEDLMSERRAILEEFKDEIKKIKERDSGGQRQAA